MLGWRSATFLTSDSKTHPSGPLGSMTRTYFPLRSPSTHRNSALASTSVAKAACAFGLTLIAVFLLVVILPKRGLSSSAAAGGATRHVRKASKAVIERQRFIFQVL